jgi:tetratricopeptide (TPR) repeat protein
LPEGAAELGAALIRLGRAEEGEEWLRKAADEGIHTAAARLADFLVRSGRLAEAEPYARQAASGGEIMGTFYLGFILYSRGDTDGALRVWLPAAETGDAVCMYNVGRIFQERKQLPLAASWYRRAIDAGQHEGVYNLATALYGMGQDAEAIDCFAKAAEIPDATGLAQATYGLILFGRSQYAEARAYLNTALDAGSDIAEMYLRALFSTAPSGADGEAQLRAKAEFGDSDAGFATALIMLGRGQYLVSHYWMDRINEPPPSPVRIWRPG